MLVGMNTCEMDGGGCGRWVWTACGSVALECETEIGNERTDGSEIGSRIKSEKMIADKRYSNDEQNYARRGIVKSADYWCGDAGRRVEEKARVFNDVWSVIQAWRVASRAGLATGSR